MMLMHCVMGREDNAEVMEGNDETKVGLVKVGSLLV